MAASTDTIALALRHYYEDRMSAPDVAKLLGKDRTIIVNWLDKYGKGVRLGVTKDGEEIFGSAPSTKRANAVTGEGSGSKTGKH